MPQTNSVVPLSSTFSLHSRPGSKRTIYLDFDGATLEGTAWNSGGNTITAIAYDFDGNQDVGKGSLTILDVTPPSQVRMRLDMTAPLQAHNTVTFTLVPQGDATEVTWAMSGPMPYLSKLITTFVDMDKMVGGDFERGLKKLGEVAESAHARRAVEAKATAVPPAAAPPASPAP